MFSFSWGAQIRREIYNVKGWLPGLVSKNSIVFKTLGGNNEIKKRSLQSICGLGLSGWKEADQIEDSSATETGQWHSFSC